MSAIARGGFLAVLFIAALVLALGIVKVDVHKADADFDPWCLTHPNMPDGLFWCPGGPHDGSSPTTSQVRVQKVPTPVPTTPPVDPPPPPPKTLPPPPGPRVEWNGVFMDLSEFLCFQDAAKHPFHDTLESTGCSGA